MAGEERGEGRLEDVAQPASRRLLGRSVARLVHSSQAWYSRRSLSSSRAWPSRATSPVRRSSSRAWNRRLATATRSRTASPSVGVGLEGDLVDREAEVVEPPDPGPDAVPVAGGDSGSRWSSSHTAVYRVRTVSAASTASSKASSRPCIAAEVGQAERRRSRRGCRGRRPAGRRTATGGSRSSRHRRGRPGSCRRRAGTGCWRASSRPRRRRRGGGRRAARPSRRAAGRDTARAPAGSRISRRRYWIEYARYSVTRIGASRSGASASPTAVTAGSPATSRWRRTSNSVVGDAERLLLERVRRAVDDEEPDEVARRPDRQLAELRASSAATSARGRSQGRSSSVAAAVAQPEARETGAARGRVGGLGQSFLRR